MNELIDGRIYRNASGTHYKLLHGYVGHRNHKNQPETVCVVQHCTSKKLYTAQWARMTDPARTTMMPADFESGPDFARLDWQGRLPK